MFYEDPLFKRPVWDQAKVESALITLTPAESKRLIARAVAALPEVKAVLERGTLVIGWGTTNAFVAEEILGETLSHKTDFASGVISEGELNANHTETKIFPYVLRDGRPSDLHQKEALLDLSPNDVFIKGANAVDSLGEVGILLATATGGSMLDGWVAHTLRSCHFLCPVGLEKMVASVREVATKLGFNRYKYSMGIPVSYATFSTAKVVTEIQAIQVLSGASASHVASGGIAGSEGSVTLVLEGEPPILDQAFEMVKSIKGEPALPPPRKYAVPAAATVDHNPTILFEILNEVYVPASIETAGAVKPRKGPTK